MLQLPPAETPLNRHSLSALETWLQELGAKRSKTDACKWEWIRPQWSAEIQIEVDELRVTWDKDGHRNQCCFPYGLPRCDVEIAIKQGP